MNEPKDLSLSFTLSEDSRDETYKILKDWYDQTFSKMTEMSKYGTIREELKELGIEEIPEHLKHLEDKKVLQKTITPNTDNNSNPTKVEVLFEYID